MQDYLLSGLASSHGMLWNEEPAVMWRMLVAHLLFECKNGGSGVDCQLLHLQDRVEGCHTLFAKEFLVWLLDSNESKFSITWLRALVESLGGDKVDDTASRLQFVDVVCHRLGHKVGQSCWLSDMFE